jgi:hypothetical protein
MCIKLSNTNIVKAIAGNLLTVIVQNFRKIRKMKVTTFKYFIWMKFGTIAYRGMSIALGATPEF